MTEYMLKKDIKGDGADCTNWRVVSCNSLSIPGVYQVVVKKPDSANEADKTFYLQCVSESVDNTSIRNWQFCDSSGQYKTEKGYVADRVQGQAQLIFDIFFPASSPILTIRPQPQQQQQSSGILGIFTLFTLCRQENPPSGPQQNANMECVTQFVKEAKTILADRLVELRRNGNHGYRDANDPESFNTYLRDFMAKQEKAHSILDQISHVTQIPDAVFILSQLKIVFPGGLPGAGGGLGRNAPGTREEPLFYSYDSEMSMLQRLQKAAARAIKNRPGAVVNSARAVEENHPRVVDNSDLQALYADIAKRIGK